MQIIWCSSRIECECSAVNQTVGKIKLFFTSKDKMSFTSPSANNMISCIPFNLDLVIFVRFITEQYY